jgi:hypothetical protein
MAGAEKIGEAFVEMGAKLDPLKKDFDTAKGLTNSTIAEMGKTASRFSLGLGAKLGMPASVAALATKGVESFSAFEDSVNDLRVRFAEMGLDADKELKKLWESTHRLTREYEAISMREIFGAAQQFAEAGVALDDFDSMINAVIGHSGQLNLSLEDVVGRMIAIRQQGAAAVTSLKVPIAPDYPAQEQFNAALQHGNELFETERLKLQSLKGVIQSWTSVLSDAWTALGKFVGGITGLRTTPETAKAISEAAGAAALSRTGKTPAQRAKRRSMTGLPFADVLTDEELAAPARPTTGFIGPPAPIPQPGAGPAGEGTASILREILETVKGAVETAGAPETRPFWLGRHMESEVRLDTIPTEP